MLSNYFLIIMHFLPKVCPLEVQSFKIHMITFIWRVFTEIFLVKSQCSFEIQMIVVFWRIFPCKLRAVGSENARKFSRQITKYSSEIYMIVVIWRVFAQIPLRQKSIYACKFSR